jgi:large subunit ribosomal protein L35
MGYKFKPNKSVKKRFRVTGKGKLKRGHSLTSHLRSARTAKKKRELRRPEILFEGHAKNMRKMMGISRLHPNATKKAVESQAEAAPAANAPAKKAAPKAKATATA